MNVYERFTDRARGVVVLADLACRELGHPEVGSEHLLLGVAQEVGTAHHVLRAMGVTAEQARATIIDLYGKGDASPDGKLRFTDDAHAALETALREALGFRHSHVGTEHLLLGLLRASSCRAVVVLQHLRVDPDSVRERVLDLIGAPGFISPETGPGGGLERIQSTGSGPGVDIRALADEVARLRTEVRDLRRALELLEASRPTSTEASRPTSTEASRPMDTEAGRAVGREGR
jgi:ATP-dependent Clp protease ATP-binding subunit ClpC